MKLPLSYNDGVPAAKDAKEIPMLNNTTAREPKNTQTSSTVYKSWEPKKVNYGKGGAR